MEREIVVRGTGEARALPDLASLRVEVTADHKSQDEAYEARADLAAKVDVVLPSTPTPSPARPWPSLWVQPRTRWHRRRGHPHRAGGPAARRSSRSSVLDALGVIMSEAGRRRAAPVTGPNWSMAPTNPAYDLARRAAAEDARHRAIAYAEALGLSLGDVAWVAEPGHALGHAAGHDPPGVAMRAGMAPPPETRARRGPDAVRDDRRGRGRGRLPHL